MVALASHAPDKTYEMMVKDLEDGIFGSATGMHHRDITAAFNAAAGYLGKDTYAEAQAENFRALPEATRQAMKDKRDLGPYGIYHQFTRPEVTMALVLRLLELHKKEGHPEKASEVFARYSSFRRKEMKSKRVQEAIAARFPEMTRERMKLALAGM